jgi:putative PEP-CTERM system TPR-repeat lipoprotein
MKKLPQLLLVTTLTMTVLAGCSSQSEDDAALSHITRSETYAEQGQYRSAVLEIKNAIQKEPDNVAHVVHLAELYLQIGAARQASEVLKPWLEDQTNAVALPLADAYVRQGKHLSARETLERAAPESAAEQTYANLIRAQALRLSGQNIESLALFRKVSDTDPANVEAVAGQIQNHLELNRGRQAVETAENWLERHGENPRVLYLEGLAHYQGDNLEAATESLTKAAGGLPTSDVFLPLRRNILSLLSRTLTEQGRMTEAQVYNRVLAENTNNEVREQGQNAITAIQEGNLDDAKRILSEMLQINPDNEQAALMLGTLQLKQGNLDEGADLLAKNLDPETTATNFIRAATAASLDQGKRSEAFTTLTRAIEARPNDVDLLAMHGIVGLSVPEHHDEGVISLNKALAVQPDRVRLRFALARHYIDQNETEQALGQLRQAYTAKPDEWSTTGMYVALLLREDELTEAREIRDGLLNGYPDEPMAQLIASVADAGLGETEGAITRLEKLVAEHPEFPQAMVALARFYLETGQSDKAVDTMVQAAKATPDAIQPLQQAAQIKARNSSPEQLIAWLNQLAEDHPELKEHANALAALVYIPQGKLAEAQALLKDAEREEASPALKRAKAELLITEAQRAANRKDWATARAKAGKAATMQPDNLRFALVPIRISQMEGKLDEAFRAVEGVQETFGNQTAISLTKAAILKQQEGDKAAYQYLKNQWQEHSDPGVMPSLLALARAEEPDAMANLSAEWVEKTPGSVDARMVRADWLMLNDQGEQAAEHYEWVLARQPTNLAALNNIAWLLRESNPPRALQLATRATELAPDNAAVLDTFGWILYLQEQYAEARTALQRAHDLAPRNAEIKGHLETVKQAL